MTDVSSNDSGAERCKGWNALPSGIEASPCGVKPADDGWCDRHRPAANDSGAIENLSPLFRELRDSNIPKAVFDDVTNRLAAHRWSGHAIAALRAELAEAQSLYAISCQAQADLEVERDEMRRVLAKTFDHGVSVVFRLAECIRLFSDALMEVKALLPAFDGDAELRAMWDTDPARCPDEGCRHVGKAGLDCDCAAANDGIDASYRSLAEQDGVTCPDCDGTGEAEYAIPGTDHDTGMFPCASCAEQDGVTG